MSMILKIGEDGTAVEEKRTEKSEYIVQIRWYDEDEEVHVSVEPESTIINRIDMDDCIPCEMRLWESREFGELIPLTIHGCWHDMKRPLYIKVTRPDGSIAFDGYGSDH